MVPSRKGLHDRCCGSYSKCAAAAAAMQKLIQENGKWCLKVNNKTVSSYIGAHPLIIL